MSGNRKKTKHPRLKLAILISFLMMLLICIIVAIFLYMRYGDTIIEARNDAVRIVSESSYDTFRSNETSLVFDNSGKQIAILKGDKDMYYISFEEIPEAAKDAMIVTEDRKFYEHDGIDFKAVTAAAFSLIKNRGDIKRGASTITQQVAKNIFLTNEQTLTRKIKELFISLELEKKYEKEDIMEFYLNNIYFSDGYYGIEAASRGYFNKNCSELSLAQIVFLCAIPNSPTKYDPIENYDNTVERKNRILDQMLAAGKISDVEYNEAYNEVIEVTPSKIKKRNFVETYTMNCTVKALMKKKGFVFRSNFKTDAAKQEYNELYNDIYSECQQQLFRAGYRIYTSLDMKMQKSLQNSINEELKDDKEKSEDGTYSFQGAGVCIDNETGKVVAAVGGRSQSVEGYTFNRAFQSYRQPGSSIKPVLVYTPALERDYTAFTKIKDEAIEDGPKNSNGKYLGNITIKTAVEQSVNTVAWKLFEELTPKVCLNYLLRMNFSKISEKDYANAAALGGFTHGVSPVELASAYATIENDGIYREATCIVTITDSEGNIIVDESDFEIQQIYDSKACADMTYMLEGVIKNGTARGYSLDNMPAAAKTGTTNDKKDGWFAGFTPYYTTVVWVGHDIPKSRSDLLGNTYPARIWKTYMNEIHADLERKEFEKSDAEKEYESRPTKKPKATEEPSEEIDIEDNEPDDISPSEIPYPSVTDVPPDYQQPIYSDAPAEPETPSLPDTPDPVPESEQIPETITTPEPEVPNNIPEPAPISEQAPDKIF